MDKALAGARRQKCKIALLFLDLDCFKIINDSLGHSVGDLLLQEVAERLKKWAREQDTVARLGGDEFLIMLTQVKEIADVAVAAERLMDTMTAEFVVQGHSLNISCSIGVSIFPEHGEDCETLIKNADTAMYGAKDCGHSNFQFFAEDMNAQAVERLSLENSLRLALGKKELFLVYQPQMDVATRRITGLEALLRWQHPDLGLVPPDRFIRIAENSGLIVPIGEWVLRTACSQAQKWQEDGLPAVSVAINVSAVQFRQRGFCELIRRVLHETGLASQYLELELTESLLLANADVTLSVLRELKSMGLTLAIDDFGTGYSNFTSLREVFGVSKLVIIDRSFVSDVATNPDDAAITAAIISMAKSLRLQGEIAVCGVEDEAQMSFLRAHHCDEIQGYYFSKPLAVDDVADKLRGIQRCKPSRHTAGCVIRGARHVSLNATQIAWSISHKAETATPESSKQRNQPERSTEGTHRQGTRTPPPNRSRLSRSMTPRFIANQSSRRFPREYAVLFSKNGREALDLFYKRRPAAVLPAWNMPDRGGLESCKRIRSDFPDGYCHLILLTGNQQ